MTKSVIYPGVRDSGHFESQKQKGDFEGRNSRDHCLLNLYTNESNLKMRNNKSYILKY
ncbi:hypothetical protein HanRHA438_Chr16g0742291 [Helianthus annuus]|nr:hypothetical protein HanRHA438_Chr16g0742291 [Helianthus annuus]